MIGFLPTRKQRFKGRLKGLLGFCLLFVILFILSQGTIHHFLSGLALNLVSPFWAVGERTEQSFVNLQNFFTSKTNLGRENEQLKLIVDRQRARLTYLELVVEENKNLKQILNRALDPNPITISRIINSGREFPGGTATIDLNPLEKKELISPGLIVVTGEHIAIGELTDVYENKAKMKFYSANDQKILVNLGSDRSSVEIIGRGGGNFSASVPKDLKLEIGDKAKISLGGREFILAEISDINQPDPSAFQTILFRVPINIYQLNWIEIYAP